jgi:low temperature requirement protein LtrA
MILPVIILLVLFWLYYSRNKSMSTKDKQQWSDKQDKYGRTWTDKKVK